MSSKYLEISIGSLSVKFEQFFNSTLPRIEASGHEDEVRIMASGSRSITGVNYVIPCLWNVDAYCSDDDFDTLCLMRLESVERRRQKQDPSLTVIDTTQRFRERAPRTRALAPGAVEVSRSPYVLYYAQFNAIMPRLPEGKLTGKGFAVNLTLIEAEPTNA